MDNSRAMTLCLDSRRVHRCSFFDLPLSLSPSQLQLELGPKRGKTVQVPPACACWRNVEMVEMFWWFTLHSPISTFLHRSGMLNVTVAEWCGESNSGGTACDWLFLSSVITSLYSLSTENIFFFLLLSQPTLHFLSPTFFFVHNVLFTFLNLPHRVLRRALGIQHGERVDLMFLLLSSCFLQLIRDYCWWRYYDTSDFVFSVIVFFYRMVQWSAQMMLSPR